MLGAAANDKESLPTAIFTNPMSIKPGHARVGSARTGQAAASNGGVVKVKRKKSPGGSDDGSTSRQLKISKDAITRRSPD